MTPEFAIYRAIYAISDSVVDTYDYLPDGDASYPFVYIGNSTTRNNDNSDMFGLVNIRLDLYGIRTDREMLDITQVSLHDAFIHLEQAFGYNIRLVNQTSETVTDNTDRQPLLRTMIDLEYQYTKKEL